MARFMRGCTFDGFVVTVAVDDICGYRSITEAAALKIVKTKGISTENPELILVSLKSEGFIVFVCNEDDIDRAIDAEQTIVDLDDLPAERKPLTHLDIRRNRQRMVEQGVQFGDPKTLEAEMGTRHDWVEVYDGYLNARIAIEKTPLTVQRMAGPTARHLEVEVFDDGAIHLTFLDHNGNAVDDPPPGLEIVAELM